MTQTQTQTQTLPPAGESRRIAATGLSLNVVLHGWANSGPVVLMVHGFPDDHTVWRHQVPALVQAGYRVITPDTRGCGDSDMAAHKRDYHRDILVADLVAVLDALEVPRAHLVAHDWGAAQGWLLAGQHPQRIASYFAMSVGHLYSYSHAGLAQKLAGWYTLLFQLGGLARWLLMRNGGRFFQAVFPFPAEWPHIHGRMQRPGRLQAAMNYYAGNLDLLWAAKKTPIDVPVMALWSEGDVFLVERQMQDSERFCRRGFRYQRVNGANHWMQLHKPEEINRLLLDFLAWLRT